MLQRSPNLLIISDEKTKAEIDSHINQADYQLSYLETQDHDILRQQLSKKNHWDAIICQMADGAFYSINTLLLSKHLTPETPFIFISHLSGEKIAVDAMKNGASDFLAPNNWSSLGNTILQILPRQDQNLGVNQPHATDYLTGLLSRSEFNRRLSELLSVSTGFEENVLCHFDIDSFDVVNETSGNEAGDSLLQDVGKIIQSHLKKSDIAARLGNDEFGVIMLGYTPEEALNITNKIIDTIENYRFEWNEHIFQTGLCIGVVPFASNRHASILLREANQACFSAKQKGKNHIQIYHADDSDLIKHDEEIKWAYLIPKALEQNHFVLYYQPILKLDGEDYYHGEVLIRMLDDQGGILPPANFIPAAEKYDLMIGIDKFVVQKTIEFYRHYHLFYSTQPGLKKLFFSVNLSSLSLRDGAFLDFLLEQLKGIEHLPHKICFEITETCAIADADYALYFIKMLKLSGCEIALDDFGSGFASFEYLKSLEIDYVKIDGSFIKNIMTDKMDRAIVEAIVRLCQATNLKTIAEFVESKDIVDLLKTLGIDYGQGYYFSKPFPLPNLHANDADVSVLAFNAPY